MRHSSFVGKRTSVEEEMGSRSVSVLSPERSKSELKYIPRTPVLQRSHSSPLSDRSDGTNKTRSRPSSEVFKSYRPLQGQLSHLEGEAQVIREQTEVSHFTDKEKSELSRLSEKADADGDLKTELTLPDDIEEEGQVEAEPVEETQIQPDDEKEVNIAETDEVEGLTDESQVLDTERSLQEQKPGGVTPKSLKTPSQSASMINGEDVPGIPEDCCELSILSNNIFIYIHLFMFSCFGYFWKKNLL